MAPAAVTFDTIESDYNAKHPKSALLESLNASADETDSTTVDSISAGAVSFQQSQDELIWVKSNITMTVKGGRHIYPGDFVQLKKGDANLQVSLNRAEFATEAQVAAAQKGK